MRKFIFLLALLFIILIISLESSRLSASTVGGWLAPLFSPGQGGPAEIPLDLFSPEQQQEIDDLRGEKQDELAELEAGSVEGLAVPALKFVDGILLFTLVLMGAGFVIPARIQGRIQGVITLIFAIVVIITALINTLAAVAKLLVMVALFLSIPFGTLVYLAVYGSFPKGATLAVLSLLFLLKLLCFGALVLTNQRYLENKGLVLLVLTTLVLNLILSFIFGLLPGILASIVDALAAIIVGVVAIIWAIILLIGAIIAIILALKVV